MGNRSEAAHLVKEYIEFHGDEDKARNKAIPIAKAKLFICGVCHGEDGNSARPDIPHLAGQNPAYLVEQMLNFKTKKRLFQAMHDLVKRMTDRQIVALALYFSGLERVGLPVNAELAAKGKPLYDAVCLHCHGPDANGSDIYARLSGQRQDYLVKNLKRFRDGDLARSSQEMSAVTRGLTDQEIEELAAYVASR
ncbi:MAG: c-type cytochrome [Gammaproteobacteria bacterium]|nr:c-type cytochrome [Gammaproteobacteria bacterium]